MENFLTTNSTTWTFDKELTLSGAGGTYQYGVYCNGDYWIIGPVTLIAMTPAWNGTYNGAELNCIPNGWDQGLTIPGTSKYSGTYTSSRNVADEVPMVLQPQSALLSSSGWGNCGVYDGDNMWIDRAAVLTVLNTPPPANSFRPGYAGTTRYHRGTEDDIRYDRLARVAPASGMTSLTTHTARFDTCQPSHMGHHLTYVTLPCGDGPVGYGADNGGMVGEAVLAANCDFTAVEKRNLVVALIQKGIDMYSILDAQSPGGVCWYPNGGNSAFEKLTILFAGVLLDNAALMDMSRSGDHVYEGGSAGNAPSDYWHIAHDDQTFYVKSADVARGNGWSSGDIGLPEWGIRHSTNPSLDSASWGAAYRRCCTAASWGAGILAVHMMSLQGVNMKGLWNHPVFFDYMDRYLSIEPPNWDWFRHPNPSWSRTMWATYRAAYPPVWPGTAPGDTTPPLPPTSLVSPQQSDTTISLSWTAGGQASDGDYPVGYRIYRDSVLITSITGTSYTDTGLAASTAYLYDIYSYDDAGNDSTSAASNTYSTEAAAPAITKVFINGNGAGDDANDGSSWLLAKRYLPSTLTRGTTYYIGTGDFGSYTFNDAADSTKIIIQKATLADHGIETGWNNTYAGLARWGNLDFTLTSHIDFLGAATTQTLIQHSGSVPQPAAVDIYLSNNIRIEYCEIDGMNGGLGNLACFGVNMATVEYIWLEYCHMHDVADDVIQCYGGDFLYIRWNRLYNAHAMLCGVGNAHSDAIELGSVSDCEIIGNFVYNIQSTSALITDNWTGNYCYRLFIANNIFYNNEAGVYFNVYLDNTVDTKFYNNILWGFINGDVTADGGLAI